MNPTTIPPCPTPGVRAALSYCARALYLSLGFSLSFSALAGVGLTSLDADGLTFTLLYPTDTEASRHEMGPYTIDVAMDAPVLPGEYKVVVMSHGTGGSPLADHALAERFVAGGFVVAMPLHQGDNFRDTELAGPKSWQQRPGEVSAVLDYLESAPEWSEHLELSRVGVHGMSAGGITGLALAGGRWRVAEMAEHCVADGDRDEGFCYLGAAEGSARLGRALSYQIGNLMPEVVMPEKLGTWYGGEDVDTAGDPRPDQRIAAVTLVVPAAAPFSAQLLAQISIPVGVVSASRDRVLVPAYHSDYLLEYCENCTSLAVLDKAGHFDVLWPWPEEISQEVAAKFTVGGELHEDFEAAERDEMHRRVVDFMRQQL